MAKKEFVKLVTPEFRVSFASIISPRKKESGELEYSLSALFRLEADPAKPDEKPLDAAGLAQYEELRKLATMAAVEKWGSLDKLPKGFQGPFRDGTEKDYDGYGVGIKFCTIKSQYKPGLVGPDLKEIIDPKEFYSGCFARAKVHAYAWEYKGKTGVSFSLWHVQKTRDGKPFGGGGDASKEFDALPMAGVAAPAAPAPAAAASGGGFGL